MEGTIQVGQNPPVVSRPRRTRQPRVRPEPQPVASSPSPASEPQPAHDPMTCQIMTGTGLRRIKAGQVVTPMTELPDGWELINVGQGVFEAWPTAEHVKGHPLDNEAMKHTLEAVDKAIEGMLPTKEFPKRPRVLRLLVNGAWRKLFRYVQTWNDNIPVVLGEDSAFERPAYVPQFRFETE